MLGRGQHRLHRGPKPRIGQQGKRAGIGTFALAMYA
jgi:hypothetical protein